jgi:hypothetical protein
LILSIANAGTNMVNVYGNGMFQWRDAANVAHGMTTAAPTDVYGQILKRSVTLGGLNVRGYTDGDSNALTLTGILGTTTPTVAAVQVDTAKANGTGVQALATGEILFAVANNSTNKYEFQAGSIVNIVSDGSAVHWKVDGTEEFSWSTAGGMRFLNAAAAITFNTAGTIYWSNGVANAPNITSAGASITISSGGARSSLRMGPSPPPSTSSVRILKVPSGPPPQPPQPTATGSLLRTTVAGRPSLW